MAHKLGVLAPDAAIASELDDRSRFLRRLVVRGLEGGGRGHVGSSMSLVEILRVLYDDILR
jgi:transketolase